MGDLGVAPICLSTFPDGCWPRSSSAGGRGPAPRPVTRSCRSRSRCSSPTPTRRRASWAAATTRPISTCSADHYESDANPWADIPEYTDFSRMFANLRKLTDPAELGPFMDSNLVGSPATICRRIDRSRALGFNYFMVSSRHARHAVRAPPAHDDALRPGSVPALLAGDAPPGGVGVRPSGSDTRYGGPVLSQSVLELVQP